MSEYPLEHYQSPPFILPDWAKNLTMEYPINPPTIKFKALHPDFQLPTKAKEGDACYDMVAHTMEVKDGYIHYGLGCSIECPEGWQALIFPRSSISNMDLVLTNSVGVLDSGYRGELGARFKIQPPIKMGFSKVEYIKPDFDPVPMNDGYQWKVYQVGQRVCQIQFLPLPKYILELVEELSTSQRSTGGFGSSGV